MRAECDIQSRGLIVVGSLVWSSFLSAAYRLSLHPAWAAALLLPRLKALPPFAIAFGGREIGWDIFFRLSHWAVASTFCGWPERPRLLHRSPRPPTPVLVEPFLSASALGCNFIRYCGIPISSVIVSLSPARPPFFRSNIFYRLSHRSFSWIYGFAIHSTNRPCDSPSPCEVHRFAERGSAPLRTSPRCVFHSFFLVV